MTANVEAPLTGSEVHEGVRRHTFLFLIQGILLIVGGVIAFVYPLLTTLAVTLFLGWMMIFGGIVQAISLVVTSRVPHFWLQLVSAVLWVITGFLFIRNPAVAVSTLAILMVVFFMVEGIAKVVLAVTVRPLANWGWVLASGLIGIAIAFYLIANPALTLVALGLFIGIQLISEGVAIAWMAWTLRKS